MVAIFTGSGTGFERGSGSVLGGMGLIGQASMGRNGEQVMLNAANGNLLISQRDEFLVGRGPDAAISRTYNSQGNFSDENGDNWRQSTHQRLVWHDAAGHVLKRTTGDGSDLLYTWDGSAFVSKDGGGAHDKIVRIDGGWRWTDGDTGTTETYGDAPNEARLIERADTSGNRLTFSYAGDKLGRVTTADGGFVDYHWSGNNITQIVTGSHGTNLTRTRYGYDHLNRLTTVTVDLTPEDNVQGADGYTTSYGYHGSSKLIAFIAQTDGSRIDLGYDGANRVASMTQKVADGVGRTTTIAYGHLHTHVTDAAGQLTALEYNADGSLRTVIAPPAAWGAAQQVVRFGYNGAGDLIDVTDAAGAVTRYDHDARGNVVSETDRLGNVTTRTYGSRNELLTETRVASDQASGGVHQTTRYVYDAANRLRWVISAEGRVTHMNHDGFGLHRNTYEIGGHFYNTRGLPATVAPTDQQMIDWWGAVGDKSENNHEYFEYDARGGLTQHVRYGGANGGGGGDFDDGYSHTYFSYDQAGQLLRKEVASLNAEHFTYDGLGRLKSSTDLAGGTTSIAFHDAGSQTVVTLANGFVKTSTFNKAGELVATTDGGDFVAGGAQSYRYDQLGRLRMSTDATGFNNYILYDKVGRKVADINHYGHVTEYRYDANDRLVASVSYTHDAGWALGHLADPNSVLDMSQIRPGGHPYDVWTWNVYDADGRVVQTIDGTGGVASFEYDEADRLVRTTSFANKLSGGQIDGFKGAAPTGPVSPAGSALDRVSRSFYDRDGLLIGTLDGEGYLTRIFYDPDGTKVQEIAYANLTRADLRHAHSFNDIWNNLYANPANDRSTRYVYDGQGQLRFTVDGLNQVTEYRYESGPNWSSVGLVRETIQYAAPIGGLGAYTLGALRGAVAGLAGHGGNRVSRSVYDGAGRLVYSIDAGGGVTGFAYDNMGQVTRSTRFANTLAIGHNPSHGEMEGWANGNGNAANRITRNYHSDRGELRFVIDPEGFVTRNDYDAQGRVVKTVRWSNAVAAHNGWDINTVNAYAQGPWVETNISYDAAGRVAYTYDGEGNHRHYGYHANGTLAWDIAMLGHPDESRTYYENDGAGRTVLEIRAWNTAEQAISRFEYDGHGNLTALVDPNGNRTTRGYDKLGRMTSQTDAAGGVASWGYNAFGEAIRATDARGFSTWSYFDRLGQLTHVRDAEDFVTETVYTIFGEVDSVTRRYNRTWNGGNTWDLPGLPYHSLDATTRFEYDKLGRVVKSTDAEGNYEQYTLDAFGQRTGVRNKIDGWTYNRFDRRGLLVEESLPMASIHRDGWVQAERVANRFEYDARGNRTRMVEAAGLPEQRTTTYAYDRADRLVETRGDAVQPVDQGGYNIQGWTVPTERIVYDTRGNVVETIDALGARTLFYYDDQNRKTEQVDALGNMVSWRYNANGNLTHERRWAAVATWAHSGNRGLPGVTADDRVTNYTYDGLGRMTSSSIAAVRTGRWDGWNYHIASGDLTTRYDYDAAGNLVRTTDANGAATHSYYDKLGRKTREVDAENHVTGWLYDADGNVYHERRWAQKTGYAVIGGMHDPGVAGDDRVTDFTYDKNGRRLTETRRGVEAYNVNGWGGWLERTSSDATVVYEYNGLGQVVRKVEATAQGPDANQHDTLYSYDKAGRLATEARAYFLNAENNWVRPVVNYGYDGLSNLTRTAQTGSRYDGIADQPTRTTRYAYKAGGRLDTMTDAAGTVFTHWHDVAGNLLVQTWNRNRSDGAVGHEGVMYTRDLLGRVTSQAVGGYNGGWAKGDVQNTQYNSFGDVSAKGINGTQEQFGYDNAGRLQRSNGGDGVWRYFLYDARGNQTAAIENEGRHEFVNARMDDVLWYATSGFGHGVGAAYIDGVNATLNGYDRRGQATQTVMTRRQLSTDGSTHDLSVTRGYNAFGEATYETDARGFRTDYTYNTMGRTLSAQRDWALITLENGVQQWVRPTENYFYDLGGRMVGVQDANGNRNARLLLNGTGFGGNEAQVAAEFHADGGVARSFYDVFGDKRRTTDEIGRSRHMNYDAMGRLNHLTHANGRVEAWLSDVLGQQIHHYDSAWGYHVTTDYDVQGRVVRAEAFGRDVTTTSYAWNGGMATWGIDYFGGWRETVTHANGLTSIQDSDVFGRETWKRDLGGHDFQSHYDLGGKLLYRYGPVETLSFNMLNTGLVGTVANGNGSLGRYAYDQAGNRTAEYTERDWAVVQNATAGYDNLGRLTTWNEHGSSISGAASLIHDYDAAGNIRRTRSSTPVLDAQGNFSYQSVQDQWYRFDAMNRVVTAKGALVDGVISRATSGTDFTYDQVGQRMTATRSAFRTASIYNPNYDPYMYQDPYGYGGGYGDQYGDQYMQVGYDADSRETYTYDAAGGLSQVRIAESGYYDNGDGTLTVTGMGAAELKASYWNDALGRNYRQIDWLYNGDTNGTAAFDRTVEYNWKGQVGRELITSKSGNDTIISETYNDYGYNGNAALGAVTSSSTNTWKNNVFQGTSVTNTSYQWWDGAVAASVTNRASASAATFTTSYYYDGQGNLASAYIADGRPRSVRYVNDMAGQVLRRDETDNRYPSRWDRQWENGDPHEIWYRYAGRQMGYSGNNGTLDTDYAGSIQQRTRAAPAAPGAFRGGATYGGAHVDTDLSVDAITSYEQGGPSTGTGGGAYTVRGGDTLPGIAANLWGDAALWYKLAEANGLTQASALVEGTQLTIPAGVMKNTHNAGTFKPYDASEAIGDTSPTDPRPQKAAKKNKCGVFGQILLLAISVAVSFALPVVAPAVFGGLGGAIGAAVVGSIVSQSVGVVTGIQDKFSWKGVAIAGLSAAVGGGLGKVFGKTAIAGSKFLTDVVRGAAGSAITQGVGVATGLQKKFDWAGVAAAGLGAGIGGAISRELIGPLDAKGVPVNKTATTWNRAGNFGHDAAVTMADAVGQAAARSLVEGSSFGDNILAALPSAIGNTIGNALGREIKNAVYDSRAKAISASELLPKSLAGSDAVRRVARLGLEFGFSRSRIEDAFNDQDFISYLTSANAGYAARVNADTDVGRGAAYQNDEFERPENPLTKAINDKIETWNRGVEERAERRHINEVERGFASVRLFRGEHARSLTPGEISLIRDAFGPDLNLSKAAIVDGAGWSDVAAAALYIAKAGAITIGDTIFANPKRFDNDWSDVGSQKSLLLHEFTHVYQYQQFGVGKVTRDILIQAAQHGSKGAYRYDLRENTFLQETFEGQAEMVGHYAHLKATGRPLLNSLTAAKIEQKLTGSGIYGF